MVTTGSGCGIPRAETQVYDSASACFCRLPQALPTRDRHLRRQSGHCPVTEAGGWMLSPGRLRQPRLERRRTEIPFIQFREYLQCQPFRVKTDNNPLTYVMSTPNPDAVGHHWVASLAGFNFTIEYLQGADNKVADALSRVGDRLELDMDSVHELLSHSNNPMVLRAETDDPMLMQEHAQQEQEIIMQARMLEDSHVVLRNLADSHWIIAQRSELVIQLTTQWLKCPKDNHSTLAEFL